MTFARQIGGVALATFLLNGGCGAKSPVGSGSALDGTWAGTIDDSVVGTGSIVWTMSARASGVSGEWSATFPDAASSWSGPLGGVVAGSAVSLFLTPRVPLACSTGPPLSGTLGVTGTLIGGRLSGPYVVFTCEGATTGRIDVTKRP